MEIPCLIKDGKVCLVIKNKRDYLNYLQALAQAENQNLTGKEKGEFIERAMKSHLLRIWERIKTLL